MARTPARHTAPGPVRPLFRSEGRELWPFDKLTPRQAQVMHAILEGRAFKEIAFQLGVSPKTVDTHRRRLYEELGITCEVELVYLAIATGFLDVPTVVRPAAPSEPDIIADIDVPTVIRPDAAVAREVPGDGRIPAIPIHRHADHWPKPEPDSIADIEIPATTETDGGVDSWLADEEMRNALADELFAWMSEAESLA